MLLGVHDVSVLAKFEQYETENPCPRKELDDHTIYLSPPMLLTKGEPSIMDLNEARSGDSKKYISDHAQCLPRPGGHTWSCFKTNAVSRHELEQVFLHVWTTDLVHRLKLWSRPSCVVSA